MTPYKIDHGNGNRIYGFYALENKKKETNLYISCITDKSYKKKEFKLLKIYLNFLLIFNNVKRKLILNISTSVLDDQAKMTA